MRALLDYERNFYLHLAQARALHKGGLKRLQSSRECIAERVVMGAALRAALDNLRGFTRQLSHRYTEFQAKYDELIPLQSELVVCPEAARVFVCCG